MMGGREIGGVVSPGGSDGSGGSAGKVFVKVISGRMMLLVSQMRLPSSTSLSTIACHTSILDSVSGEGVMAVEASDAAVVVTGDSPGSWD